MSNEIFYLAKVSHYSLPMPLNLPIIKTNNFYLKIFNFPNEVEYSMVSDNTLHVQVSGTLEKTFTIQLYRVQNKT